MISITDEIELDEAELKFDFVRSGGPGGQKVNKTSSAVVLRFDVLNSPSLPEGNFVRSVFCGYPTTIILQHWFG